MKSLSSFFSMRSMRCISHWPICLPQIRLFIRLSGKIINEHWAFELKLLTDRYFYLPWSVPHLWLTDRYFYEINLQLEFHHDSVTRDTVWSWLTRESRCHSDLGKFSFSVRIVCTWNSFPAAVKLLTMLTRFYVTKVHPSEQSVGIFVSIILILACNFLASVMPVLWP